MGLFSKRSSTRPATTDYAPASPPPANLDGVKAEWSPSSEEGFRQGWVMFDDPSLPPMQASNAAEYMTRGLRAELHRPGEMDASDVREGCRRVIILAGRTPREPAWQDEFSAKYLRLALTLIKVNGWQPARYDGDGSISEPDLQVARPDLLVGAIAPQLGTVDEALAAFFESPL